MAGRARTAPSTTTTTFPQRSARIIHARSALPGGGDRCTTGDDSTSAAGASATENARPRTHGAQPMLHIHATRIIAVALTTATALAAASTAHANPGPDHPIP